MRRGQPSGAPCGQFAMQQVGDTFKDRFEAADAKKKRVRQRFVE